MKKFLTLALIGMVLLTSCTKSVDHKGRTPLVEVNGTYLYAEELQTMIPLGLSPTDSTAFAEQCIRDWVEEQLLYHKAEQNVRSNQRIELMVQEYRHSLILQEYQQHLIEQKLNEEVSEEDMRSFYQGNSSLFVLKEPVIQGLFIKVPISSTGLDNLKKWYKDNDEATLEKIEKYCFHNAVIYEYFYDHWVPLSHLAGKFKTDLNDLDKRLANNKNFEIEDSEYCYLLHVEDYVLGGQAKPFDLAQSEIATLLINQRKADYMQQVRSDLYDRAMHKGRITRYDNEKEESN